MYISPLKVDIFWASNTLEGLEISMDGCRYPFVLLFVLQRVGDARAGWMPLCFQDFPARFVIDSSWKDENCCV